MNKEEKQNLKQFKIKKKVDWVIVLEYSIVFALCAFMIVYPIIPRKDYKISIFDIIFVVLAIMVASYFLINLLSINYYVDDKHLYVKSGMNSGMLELKKIVEVKHKRKFFSSTITSINTLEITYSPFGSSADLRVFYITVKDEDELIKKIKEKSKKLKVNL